MAVELSLGSALVAELAVSVIAAGVLLAAVVLAPPSPEQRRARPLLLLLALALLLRAATWLWPAAPAALPLLPTLLLPLAALLWIEGLLRRQAPLPLKLAVVASTALGFALFASGLLPSSPVGTGLAAGLLGLTLVLLGALLLQRDRASLTALENQRIDGVLLAAVLGAPLLATELRHWIPLDTVRAGALAPLLVLLAASRAPYGATSARAVAAELACLLLAIAAASVSLWLIGAPLGNALALTATLIIGWTALRHLRLGAVLARRQAFHRWLGLETGNSVDAVLQSLRGLPVVEKSTLLMGSQLKRYDLPALHLFLQPRRRAPLRIDDLREIINTTTDLKQRGSADQLVQLLAAHGRNAVCLLRVQPLTLVLLDLNADESGLQAQTELGVILPLLERLEPRPVPAPRAVVA